MTSKLTREQLHERARENVKALKMASRQHAFESAREEILADLQLAELALAAMDSEPVAWDYEWASCITCEGPQNFNRVIEREAPPDWSIEEGQAKNIIPLYRHAQQPVVPDDVLDALQKVARIRLDLNDFDGDRRGIADCLGDAEEALIEVVNRRAAMLQESQKSAGESNNCRSCENVQDLQAGNSPAQGGSRCSIKAAPALDSSPKTADARCGSSPVIPDCWIPVSERMPEDRISVILWDAEIGEVTSGHYSHKTQTFYHCGDAIENEITHWMPPPCAPQEVKR